MREFVSTGAGSGVIISEDGYIVTNDHVISGAQSIKVRLSNDQEYIATLIGSDRRTDLAVLKIDAEGLQPATMGHSSALQVGQTAIAIGNPLGKLGGTVTRGIVSGLKREINVEGSSMVLMQTDASINRGNSGGGLFDESGALIGIVNAKATGDSVEGIGFAIPIEHAFDLFEQLVTTANKADNPYGGLGYIEGKFRLGVLITTISFNGGFAYEVQDVFPYGSLSKHIKKGEQIISINGKAFNEGNTLANALSALKVGDEITVGIRTTGLNASAREVDITIMQYVYGFNHS
jgi:serine protease Do